MKNRNCTDSFPRFAGDWIDAWNQRDLDGVLAHYAEDVRFTSPIVVKVTGRANGTIHGREELRAYFAEGLRVYPNLRFELLAEARGMGGTTLVYRSGSRLVCETVRFDAFGRIVEAHAHYAEISALSRAKALAAALPARIFDLVMTWIEREQERRQLAALDHHLLRDIGVTRCDALQEAGKPFWKD
jgi:uncharacterized protein YjiS (DUF1127 family)